MKTPDKLSRNMLRVGGASSIPKEQYLMAASYSSNE